MCTLLHTISALNEPKYHSLSFSSSVNRFAKYVKCVNVHVYPYMGLPALAEKPAYRENVFSDSKC